jgi:dTMP kinase
MADARPGLFLVLEGPDGSGKTTQAKRLADRIESGGRSVLLVREPGATAVGERVRALLLDPSVGDVDATTEMLLYQAARRRLVAERIRPALEAGTTVVCDRWHYSTQAYQGAGGGADPTAIRVTTRIATEGLEPSRAILLDVPDAVAASRMKRPLDRVERRGPEYRRRVATELRRIFRGGDPARFVVVDGARSEDEVAEAIWASVRDLVD